MDFDSLDRFVAVAAVGGGLLLAGGLGLFLRSRRARILAAAGSVAFAALVVAIWTESAAFTILAAIVLTVALLPSLLRGTTAIGTLAQRSRSLAPLLRSLTLVLIGLAVIGGARLLYVRDVADRRELESLNASLAADFVPPRKAERVVGLTDRGTRLELSSPTTPRPFKLLQEHELLALNRTGFTESVIQHEPASDRSNAFGWVFAGGRYWLTDGVEAILADNRYAVVPVPSVGDLAIYRSADTQKPIHAAIVRHLADGQPVLVEGKWGWMGVFLHPADRSPYGTNFAFYRTARKTHTLTITDPETDVGPFLTGAE